MSDAEYEAVDFDVVIVGGGPAGLATAIRLKQLANAASTDISICLLEKGAELGAHSLSGAVLDTRVLDELIPDWHASDSAPTGTVVNRDEFYFLRNDSSALRMPQMLVPPGMHNAGARIVSLGSLCRWLGEYAENLGVDLFCGFAGARLELDTSDKVTGVFTQDRGVARRGERKPGFEPGILLRGAQIVLAEGSRGHLGRELIERCSLSDSCDPQHYAIGLKEVWELAPARHEAGRVLHGAGWPLSENGSGGFFCYHGDDRLAAIGLIVDLNYANPFLSPFDEFQRLKRHPLFASMLEGGRRIAYGARAITKGGFNSLPRLTVPGAMLVGCDAGTLDFSRVKGIHAAMNSGIVAADTIFEAWQQDRCAGNELGEYRERLSNSPIGRELHAARNVQPALHRFGPYLGGAYLFVDQTLLRGHAPWTLHDRISDHAALQPAEGSRPIEYPSPDGRLSFDRLSSVYLSGTNHEEDQPSHLTLKDAAIPIEHNLAVYAAPEQRYCPAGVYEIVDEAGRPRLQINAQNCLHCKVCDIKDPSQNIVWVPPEDGGPAYTNM